MNQNLQYLTQGAERFKAADAFVRLFQALAVNEGHHVQAASWLFQNNGGNALAFDVAKAAVPAAGTGSLPEIMDDGGTTIAFIGGLQDQSAFARMLSAGAIARVPAYLRLLAASAVLSAVEIDQGEAIPMEGLNLVSDTTEPGKLGVLLAFSDELLADTRPGAQAYIKKMLGDALASGVDNVLMAATQAESAAFAATETTFKATVAEALASINDHAGSRVIGGVGPAMAAKLAAHDYYQNGFGPNGGMIAGVPVVVGDAFDELSFFSAGKIAGDVFGLDVKTSKNAAIQLLDNPTTNALTPTATNLVSLFQTDATAVRAVVNFTIKCLGSNVRADVTLAAS